MSNENGPCQVPLEELLVGVPIKHRLTVEERMGSSHIPVGMHCHDATAYITRLRVKLAADAAIMMYLAEENREMRVMLAVAHAGESLYADDGELQDQSGGVLIDWKREPIAAIRLKLLQRAAAQPCELFEVVDAPPEMERVSLEEALGDGEDFRPGDPAMIANELAKFKTKFAPALAEKRILL